MVHAWMKRCLKLKTASMVAGKSLTDETIYAAMEKWALSHRSEDRLAVFVPGLRKRVSILAAILPAIQSSKPRIVLLDEPSEALTPHHGTYSMNRYFLLGRKAIQLS